MRFSPRKRTVPVPGGHCLPESCKLSTTYSTIVSLALTLTYTERKREREGLRTKLNDAFYRVCRTCGRFCQDAGKVWRCPPHRVSCHANCGKTPLGAVEHFRLRSVTVGRSVASVAAVATVAQTKHRENKEHSPLLHPPSCKSPTPGHRRLFVSRARSS